MLHVCRSIRTSILFIYYANQALYLNCAPQQVPVHLLQDMTKLLTLKWDSGILQSISSRMTEFDTCNIILHSTGSQHAIGVKQKQRHLLGNGLLSSIVVVGVPNTIPSIRRAGSSAKLLPVESSPQAILIKFELLQSIHVRHVKVPWKVRLLNKVVAWRTIGENMVTRAVGKNRCRNRSQSCSYYQATWSAASKVRIANLMVVVAQLHTMDQTPAALGMTLRFH